MQNILIAISFAIIVNSSTGRPIARIRPRYRPVRMPHHMRHTPRSECTSVFNRTEGLIGRSGLINTRYRWQRFDVKPDTTFSSWELQNIQNAMAVLSKQLPCIDFGYWIPGSTPTVRDYIRIVRRSGGGCDCWVGRLGGVQIMNLDGGCAARQGSIMHEMCHGLGLHHEHQRPDRDNYINIFWQNILQGRQDQFTLISNQLVSDFGIPYNTRSIMHYGSYSHSAGGFTMLTKNNQRILGDEQLQQSDVTKLKRMYGCN